MQRSSILFDDPATGADMTTADDPWTDTMTDRSAIDALRSAVHGDPFAVLGPYTWSAACSPAPPPSR